MTATFIEAVFRNCSQGQGLSFFQNGEPQKLQFREREARIEIWCAIKKRWKKATREELVRQCFIVWIRETLKYPLARIQVERRVQVGSDCWSKGNDYSFQLREENPQTKKAPYTFRDIPRLPAFGQELSDILSPLSFRELRPVHDLRSLVVRLEHDALSNAGVTAFDELFKLFFAKLHDELRPRRKEKDPVEFRVPVGNPEIVCQRINGLFQA